jgi:ubiquitin C-terminal hydrolase
LLQELIVKLLDILETDTQKVFEKKAKKKKGNAVEALPAPPAAPPPTLPPGGRLIGDLFEYQSRTELVCRVCHHASGPPLETNKSLFVPVKGFDSLPRSLGELFKAETRRTDCDSEQCQGAKRDKACSLAVKQLPPLLWCSLLRFDYDWNKQERVKVRMHRRSTYL